MSDDLYSEIPLPSENDNNKPFSFNTINCNTNSRKEATGITSNVNSQNPSYIPRITTTTFRRDGNTLTAVEVDYGYVSKFQTCSHDIWDDGDDGIETSKSTLADSEHRFYYPRSRVWTANQIARCNRHWQNLHQITYEKHGLPTQYQCEKVMLEFKLHCENRRLLYATSGDVSTRMTYMTPINVFSNLEFIMFLLQCYFEGFPTEILIAFKIKCRWGDDNDYSKSGDVTLKSVLCLDGWMGENFRKNLRQQYDDILNHDHRRTIISRESENVMPDQPIKVKLDRFKAITIVMKYDPDTDGNDVV